MLLFKTATDASALTSPENRVELCYFFISVNLAYGCFKLIRRTSLIFISFSRTSFSSLILSFCFSRFLCILFFCSSFSCWHLFRYLSNACLLVIDAFGMLTISPPATWRINMFPFLLIITLYPLLHGTNKSIYSLAHDHSSAVAWQSLLAILTHIF